MSPNPRRARACSLRFAPGLALLSSLAALAACGSRSGLLDLPSSSAPSSSGPVGGSGAVGGVGSADSGPAFGSPPPQSDADADIPLIDAAIPEAGVACAPGTTDRAAYLISGTGTFYAFDPASLQAHVLGRIACPTTSSPFTMTVTETSAYVLYLDNTISKIDLATLACQATPFVAPAGYSGNFGLASAYVGTKEWLEIYGCFTSGTTCTATLSRVDPSTFAISVVGPVVPFPPSMTFPAEMKADAFGHLFMLDYPGNLLEVDNQTAHVIAYDATGFALPNDGEALLTWNGALYFFGGTSGAIDQYDLATRTLVALGQVGDEIVGAGAAPCTH